VPARDTGQPVLDIIGIAVAAIRGQIAIIVMGKARAAHGSILVEAVGRIIFSY
jgi:hypothetical protein